MTYENKVKTMQKKFNINFDYGDEKEFSKFSDNLKAALKLLAEEAGLQVVEMTVHGGAVTMVCRDSEEPGPHLDVPLLLHRRHRRSS